MMAEKLKPGDEFSRTRVVTDELIRDFARVSGDHNPIHLDDEYAQRTRFGRRIAHGMLSGAFISAVLGDEFQEQRIVYLSQSLKFIAPVFIGNAITATARVSRIREEKGIVFLETTCTDQDGRVTCTGEAAIMILD